MLRSCCVFILFCFFAINILTIETRSIPEQTIQSILNDPLHDNNRKLLHTFSSYRYRFEHSANFKTLQWTLKNLQVSGLCELCEWGAPLVSSFIHFGFSNLSFFIYTRFGYS
jgi:hypothetical protein